MFFSTTLTQFLSLLGVNNIAVGYRHPYPAGISVPSCLYFHLPHNSVSTSSLLSPSYLQWSYDFFFKFLIAFWHLHDPQNVFKITFELLCFGCNYKDKEEVCTWLLADLTFLLLTCFACRSALWNSTSLPICYIHTSLSVLSPHRFLFCGWISLHFLPYP